MNEQFQEQLDVFARYLKKNGLKMTRQRELLVRTFLEAEGHLSADELFELVKKKDQKLGFATVFRTLKALTECGLARETDLSDGRTRFEKLYKRPEHHHIVCEGCGKTIEFFSPELEELEKKIVAQYKIQPIRQRIQIFGVCQDCQEQEQAPSTEVYDNDLVFARDALKIAMETERRGINFYKAAAENSKDPSTRAAFLEMLEEEKEHFSNLQKEWKSLIARDEKVLEAPVFLHFDFEALERIFPSREKVEERMGADLSETEALELAMNMER